MPDPMPSSAPHLYKASTRGDLVDWGVQPDAIDGQSRSTGRLVHKGPNNQPECGIWVCTPGRWRLSIPRDELCHFVAGRATYRSDDGETIAVDAGHARALSGRLDRRMHGPRDHAQRLHARLTAPEKRNNKWQHPSSASRSRSPNS